MGDCVVLVDRNIDLRNRFCFRTAAVAGVTMELYDHQKTALAYLRSYNSFMLFMEQGTGKTIPTLTRLNELIQSKAVKTALVICPKSVMGSWDRDIQMFDAESQTRLKTHVEVINYDKVWRYDRNKFNQYDRQYDVIVIDEAHSIKNRTSKRAAFILKLAVRAKYRYALTGTPISNGQLENFWSLICFLDPYSVGSRVYSNIFRIADGGKGSYYEFLEKYALLDQFHKPYRYRNVTALQEIVDDYSYRVTKNECLDLPDKLPDEIIELELPDKKLYKEIAKHSASLDIEFVADNPLVKLSKLRQIASGFLIDDSGSKIELKCEKISALDEFLDGFDKKLVIFAEFTRSIDNIVALLKKRKLKTIVLDGRQKDKSIWRNFQSDESIRVIVCQYVSGCQGIDLFAADTILYYEPTLRSNILEQSRDRIHRNGQTQKCSYIHFITKGTVEKDIYRSLAGFSDFNEKLFTQYISEYQRAQRGIKK